MIKSLSSDIIPTRSLVVVESINRPLNITFRDDKTYHFMGNNDVILHPRHVIPQIEEIKGPHTQVFTHWDGWIHVYHFGYMLKDDFQTLIFIQNLVDANRIAFHEFDPYNKPVSKDINQ